MRKDEKDRIRITEPVQAKETHRDSNEEIDAKERKDRSKCMKTVKEETRGIPFSQEPAGKTDVCFKD